MEVCKEECFRWKTVERSPPLRLIEKTCTALGTRPLKATLKTFDQCKFTINVYVSLSNDKREQEHDSSFSSWCCSSGGSCQHSQKNKWRLFTQLEKVVNCSHKLGPEDPWTLVYIWRVYRGKILTDNHVGLSIIGTLSDPVWVMIICPSLDGLPSMMPIKRTSITSRR